MPVRRRALIGALITMALIGASRALSQAPDEVTAAWAAARAQALAGDVIAQFSLGSRLLWSGGDLQQAETWLRMAADQSYAPAEFELSQLLEAAPGSERDAEMAMHWLRRSAEHGFPPAQRALGDRYRAGSGVAQDLGRAAEWYRPAAEAGDLLAQYHLGQLHFEGGTGVAQDYLWAYVWFDLAAAQTPLEDNWKALFELRNICAVRMTSEQLETARRLVGDRSRAR
jgi:TPR repeat protein